MSAIAGSLLSLSVPVLPSACARHNFQFERQREAIHQAHVNEVTTSLKSNVSDMSARRFGSVPTRESGDPLSLLLWNPLSIF